MDDNQHGFNASRKEKLTQAKTILRELGFGSRQSSDIAGYTLLALANVRPNLEWSEATTHYAA
ncbi:hypothetical protein [Chloroflexus sp.]|uniref:hypothetical protein n=1 Tax=Chloroflexus sp. TaxID=1904827 RepID=UPI002ACE700B|nr:hypothetical protein [Chloroflexus sp.]